MSHLSALQNTLSVFFILLSCLKPLCQFWLAFLWRKLAQRSPMGGSSGTTQAEPALSLETRLPVVSGPVRGVAVSCAGGDVGVGGSVRFLLARLVPWAERSRVGWSVGWLV